MIFLVQYGLNKLLLIFSKITNCTCLTGSCNFVSLWKNVLVLIYSKIALEIMWLPLLICKCLWNEFCQFFSFYFRMIFYLKYNLKIFHVRANSYHFFSLAPKEEEKEKKFRILWMEVKKACLASWRNLPHHSNVSNEIVTHLSFVARLCKLSEEGLWGQEYQ